MPQQVPCSCIQACNAVAARGSDHPCSTRCVTLHCIATKLLSPHALSLYSGALSYRDACKHSAVLAVSPSVLALSQHLEMFAVLGLQVRGSAVRVTPTLVQPKRCCAVPWSLLWRCIVRHNRERLLRRHALAQEPAACVETETLAWGSSAGIALLC